MFWLDSRPLLNPSTTFITPILYLCSLVPTPSFSSLCLMLMNTHSHFPSFFSSFHVFPSVYSSFYLSFHSPLSSIVSCPTPNLFQQLFVSTPFLFHTFSFGSFTIITFFLLFDILNFFICGDRRMKKVISIVEKQWLGVSMYYSVIKWNDLVVCNTKSKW